MFEILSLEKQSVLWRRDGTNRFEDMLREQAGVCTPSRFKSFKKASEYFPRSTIDRLGVPCVCLLATKNAGTRERLLKYALEFQKKHGAEPTYQYFSRYLRDPNKPPSVKRLKKYIERLKQEIRDLGGRVPAME